METVYDNISNTSKRYTKHTKHPLRSFLHHNLQTRTATQLSKLNNNISQDLLKKADNRSNKHQLERGKYPLQNVLYSVHNHYSTKNFLIH